jgi:peroxiredoxin
MKKVVSIVFVGCLVAIGAWFAFKPYPPAPNVSIEMLQGKSIELASLKNNVVLVEFWATSCVTCVKQMPSTVELYKELSPKGFEVIAVAMSYDPVEFVRRFTESRQLPFIVGLDTNGAVAKAFGDVKLTPTFFLIDKKGRIIKQYLGNYDKADLRQTIEKALAQS